MDYKKERIKILDLLSKGVLKAEEADKILDALDKTQQYTTSKEPKKASFKMLKIYMISENKEKINISIPLEFVNLLKNKRFNGVIKDAHMDIDIEEIIELAKSGVSGELINIETKDGDMIKITIA